MSDRSRRRGARHQRPRPHRQADPLAPRRAAPLPAPGRQPRPRGGHGRSRRSAASSRTTRPTAACTASCAASTPPRCVRIVDRERRLLDVAGVPVTVLQDGAQPARHRLERQPGAARGRHHRRVRRPDALAGRTAAARCAGTSPPAPRRSSTAPPSRCKAKGRSLPDDADDAHLRHQPRRLRPAPAPPGLGRVVHDHGARPHDQAAARPLRRRQRDDGVDEHGPRGHELAERARLGPRRRRRRTCGAAAARSTASSSPRPTPRATLEQVIPEIGSVGFMADSVRVPDPHRVADHPQHHLPDPHARQRREHDHPARSSTTSTPRRPTAPAGPAGLQRAAERAGRRHRDARGGGDRGRRDAHAHRLRRAWTSPRCPACRPTVRERPATALLEVPVTHAKIFGWYDNEYGSYTNLLGDLTVHVHANL